MSVAELVPLVLKTSILMIIFALGLKSRPSDVTHLLRHPGQLARSLLVASVIMPLLAIILIKVIGLNPAVAAALFALSLAPVPPVLPNKAVKAGGDFSYVVGLFVAASVIAIVWIPIAVKLVGVVFDVSPQVPAVAVARLVVPTLLAPLAAGMLVARFAPSFAASIQNPVSVLGSLLLLVAAIPIFATKWPLIMAQVGDGTLWAFVAFAIGGLFLGHVFGGPAEGDRTVLALAAASRHPGIAIAIAMMNSPGEQAIIGAVALYLLVSAVLTIPYVMWRTRHAHGSGGAPHSLGG